MIIEKFPADWSSYFGLLRNNHLMHNNCLKVFTFCKFLINVINLQYKNIQYFQGPVLGWLNTLEAFQKTGTTIPLNLKVCFVFTCKLVISPC